MSGYYPAHPEQLRAPQLGYLAFQAAEEMKQILRDTPSYLDNKHPGDITVCQDGYNNIYIASSGKRGDGRGEDHGHGEENIISASKQPYYGGREIEGGRAVSFALRKKNGDPGLHESCDWCGHLLRGCGTTDAFRTGMLPSANGWVAMWSQSNRKFYYRGRYDISLTSWTDPAPLSRPDLPDGWQMVFDPEKQGYYYKDYEGYVQWDIPTTTCYPTTPPSNQAHGAMSGWGPHRGRSLAARNQVIATKESSRGCSKSKTKTLPKVVPKPPVSPPPADTSLHVPPSPAKAPVGTTTKGEHGAKALKGTPKAAA